MLDINPKYTSDEEDNYDRGLKKPDQYIKKFYGKKVIKT